VLSNEFVRALPASRGYGNYLAGVPGIQGTGLGASATPSNNFFTARGGRSSEGNIQIDGMNVGSSVGGGGVSGYQYDMSNASEVQVTIAGGLAEVDRGGPAFNMIPKTGGNTFSGFYFASLAGKWSQGSNIDAELESYGFVDQAALIRNWDTNFAFSGPILRDKLWQAEYMVSAVRDHTLALACIRLGQPSAHGRGMDSLPESVTRPLLESMIRHLSSDELWRAFDAVLGSLTSEVNQADPALGLRVSRELSSLSCEPPA